MGSEYQVRPSQNEYDSAYGGYVDAVGDGDILATLEGQTGEFSALLNGIPEPRQGFRYAAGKWSIREVVGHLADAERVFGYRALVFGRGDSTELPSFDENEYMIRSRFEARDLANLGSELEHLRQSNLLMFRGFDREAWHRSGVANSRNITVRALAWIMAGHLEHHKRVLLERYL